MGNEKTNLADKETIITLVRGSAPRLDPPHPLARANPVAEGTPEEEGSGNKGTLWTRARKRPAPGVKAQCAAPCGPGPSFTISLLKRASAQEHVVRWASRLSQRKADKTGKWLQRPPSDSHELLVPQAWGVLAKKNCQVQGHEASAP